MEILLATTLEILREYSPQTVRQVYYQLVSRGALKKTESEYTSLVKKLARLREDGVVPWEAIIDNSRAVIEPTMYSNPEQALRSLTETYRRDLWEDAEDLVMIWCEKDALSSVIDAITDPLGVPLYPARGFSSVTFQHDAAERIVETEKPTYIYHFTDLDDSGLEASRDLEDKLRSYSGGCDITFERPAITKEQVEQFNLPMRPPKKSSHGKGEDDCIELDALPVLELQRIVRECIEPHVDDDLHARVKEQEEDEKRRLSTLDLRDIDWRRNRP